MAAPVGSIWELTLVSDVAGQRCLNVLHYVTDTEPVVASIAAETLELATAADAVGALGPAFRNCLANNTNHVEIVAQCIKDTLGTRYARQVLDIDEVGLFAEAMRTPNVAAVITKRTAFAGRWAVGSFHMPGVPASIADMGVLADVAYEGALGVLAAELRQNIVTANGGVYTPILYHPTGAHDGKTPVAFTEVQPEIRVMRRRTVRLGI